MAVGINLDDKELELARLEAARRQSYNESKGLKGRNRAPAKGEKALEMHTLGCIGELAVAKYLDMVSELFKNEAPSRDQADLPGNIEVKTRPKHHYDLLIQLDDNPGKIFVLVTCESQEEPRLVGWIDGESAMKASFVREYVKGRPCYSIPASKLNPIATIPRLGEPVVDADQAGFDSTIKCGSHNGAHCLTVDKSVLSWIGAIGKGEICLGIMESSDGFVLYQVNERNKSIDSPQ